MILLVSPIERANDCARVLHENTGEEVVVAENLRRAATLLRSNSYLAVVLDQHLLETEPDEIDTAMQHLGTAIPVQVNLAISGLDRLVREVRAALERRKHEEAAARKAAASALRSELSGPLTALLLECELALKVPGLSATAVEKLQSAHELVQKLRAQIEDGFNNNGSHAAHEPF
jgi:signal transduction histidine kinase